MSVKTWVQHPKEDLSTLNIPFKSEKDRENECFVYSLAMAIEFVSEEHPTKWVRESMKTLSPETIRNQLTIGDAGWKAKNSEKDFAEISEKAGPINFEHKLRDQSPAEETLVSLVNEHLERRVPVIPFINAKLLRRDKKAGVHAVVVTGVNDEHIAIHDPWGYPKDIVERGRFLEAWDDVLNQVVTIKLGGQQTLGSGRTNIGGNS